MFHVACSRCIHNVYVLKADIQLYIHCILYIYSYCYFVENDENNEALQRASTAEENSLKALID